MHLTCEPIPFDLGATFRIAHGASDQRHNVLAHLGSPDDERIVAAIRQATSARLRVDANAGWTRSQAASLIPRLAQYGLDGPRLIRNDPYTGVRFEGARLVLPEAPGLGVRPISPGSE